MPPRFEVITFDCYGTLIDWERGIAEAFAALAARLRSPVDTKRALELYAQIEPAVEAEPFRSYQAVLTETARRVAALLHWPLPAAHAGFLAESLPYWRPFPDTNRALWRLAEAGHRLGILSNVDDDLLAWTRRHLLAGFDVVVTAQQVGSYKPATAHFLAARAAIGTGPWLHAAQSYFHDIAPARTLGISTAWINRKGEVAPDGGRPDRECGTLLELADWLAP